MDIERILRARANRTSRIARPFSNFVANFSLCNAAGQLVLARKIDENVRVLVSRSVIITTVSAIEVYYRDILDFTFRYCAPAFFEPHLKSLHPEKIDVLDLVKLFEHNVHPYELISSAQSFQNAERIDKIFSLFLSPGGLWAAILGLQARHNDQPENVVTWTHHDLDGLKRTFRLRHELVHDPSNTFELSQENLSDVQCSAHMIFGSDFILAPKIQENRDASLPSEPAF